MKNFKLLALFLMIATASVLYSCKKSSNSAFVNVSGTTWRYHISYVGFATYDAYIKYLSTNRFLYSNTPPPPDPSADLGKWSQNVNDIKVDFDAGFHYKGTLISADSITGTMIDSTTLTPGTWTAKKL